MHPNKDGMGGWSRCGEQDRRSAGFKRGKWCWERPLTQGSSISLREQTPVPDTFLGEGTKLYWSPLATQDGQGWAKEGAACRKCPLWFHLGASNLPTSSLNGKSAAAVIMYTGLKMGIQVFPVPLTGGHHWPWCMQARTEPDLSLSWLFLPGWWLVKLIPHGCTFPVAHGASCT